MSKWGGGEKDFLALTFINNLEDELKKELEGLAKVYTFHGYCLALLLKYSNLRYGLKKKFYYYPPLVKLVQRDWEIIKKNASPHFYRMMRDLQDIKDLLFFIKRGNYYNATGYDDSVYRVYKSLESDSTNLCIFNLLQGTEYFPNLANSILFLEDDEESAPHDFDRDLQSLIHLPEFTKVKGLVIGRFQNASEMTKEKLIQIIKTKKELHNMPVVTGVDFGHTDPKITFPIGGQVELELTKSSTSIKITRH